MRAMLLMGVRLVEAAARVVAGLSWPSTRSERLSFALRDSSGSVGLVTVLTISGVLALLMISNLLLGIDVKREEVFDPYLSQYTHIVEYAESHQMVSEYSQCKYKHGKSSCLMEHTSLVCTLNCLLGCVQKRPKTWAQ